ncbi:MAG: hypothetical protein MI865_08885, partial [Proteobacteria bacterium]|nr:hypothetical protein [Pseudomonadota bacterium]
STGTFTVTVTDDALVEATETVIAQISNSSNGDVSIGTASATANITDNATTSPPSSDSDDDFVYDENVNADKIPPVESDPGENSDRELSADGAVLDAVSDASSLGSTRALDADGAVLDAVEGANSSTIYFGDTISGELADNVGLWDISGVKGFAVSFSLSETTQGSETDLSLFPLRIATPEAENRDHLLIKSILRDRTLFLEIDYVNSNADLITVSNISILQVDGNPLPEWLRIDDEGGLVSGEPPVGTETIELRIEVTLSDDTAIIRYIDVNVSSGEIAALEKVGNEFIAGASLFDQQIEEEAVKFENSSEDIKKSFIN